MKALADRLSVVLLGILVGVVWTAFELIATIPGHPETALFVPLSMYAFLIGRRRRLRQRLLS